ncbi:hypothetical protein [Actinoplanes sp. L3-i22]|uniref:hypothetical protein n=1 Tax=Actinoplanes sp. L3-i22 TaxID=2836373 RepID=UPI001C74970D|nr:hypothetical protein [Actinoplanes sp. L3-i22]BCY09204.1 hypothetical protein L3i22_042920 [Actinoplanes sp. L3-i22]
MISPYGQIWNEALLVASAGNAGESVPRGLLMLSRIQRVFGAVESDGIIHAMETNSDDQVRHAIEAYRYFELPEEAELLEDLRAHRGDDEYMNDKEPEVDRVLDSESLDRAVKGRIAAWPHDFNVAS